MAREFKETAHNKIDQKKFEENFDSIDWSKLKNKPLEQKSVKRHATAGLCGEFGMSTFDKAAFDENFDQIKWGKDEEAVDPEAEAT